MKRLSDLTLDFYADNGLPRMWSVLIGENGTGKTSVLQAIALAAAGSTYATSLVERSIAHLADRRQSAQLEITARFSIPQRQQSQANDGKKRGRRAPPPSFLPSFDINSEVHLRPGEAILRSTSAYEDQTRGGGDPLFEARAAASFGWFVVGYGVNRVLPTSGGAIEFSIGAAQRLRPLFDLATPLISTDFITVFKDKETKRQYSQVLQRILIDTGVLPKDISALELRGQGGVTLQSDLLETARFSQQIGKEKVKVPAVALAHGYQSTIAWIADLVGQIVLEAQRFQQIVDVKDFQGLVLIDEIDLYLHPVWQASLIPALRGTFPKVQFIVTTHSPVVLATLSPDEVVRLQADDVSGSVRRVAPYDDAGSWGPVRSSADVQTQPDPRLLTGTEIYQEYFGVDRLTLNEHGEYIRAYTALATNPLRNDYQEISMSKLRTRLDTANISGLPEPVARTSSSHK